jgi:hypothetical protein
MTIRFFPHVSARAVNPLRFRERLVLSCESPTNASYGATTDNSSQDPSLPLARPLH